MAQIDRFNLDDPRQVVVDGATYPYELLYSRRLNDWVMKLNPHASEALRIAARGQHIGRWTVPRDTYPMDRGGYLRWREDLKSFHAQKVGEILKEVGYEGDFIQTAQSIMLKKQLKQDADTQTLEDALCLVFLETQFEDLKEKEPEEKMRDILLKTWRKMSPKGRAMSFRIKLPYELERFLEDVLAAEMYGAELTALLRSTRSLRDAVVEHSLYRSVENIEQIRTFMEYHVFAVWDFMSLVKSLQMALTRTSVPWIPQGDPTSRRLINDIVLDEESDDDGEGGYKSHFELYLEAMEKCGADTARITHFIECVRKGESVPNALRQCQCPEPIMAFVNHTWGLVESNSLHRIAAALTIGREDVIPEMFQRVIRNLRERDSEGIAGFAYYLERHINVDKGLHAPMGMKMLKQLCDGDSTKWQEATEAAQMALEARLRFWDAIAQQLSVPPS